MRAEKKHLSIFTFASGKKPGTWYRPGAPIKISIPTHFSCSGHEEGELQQANAFGASPASRSPISRINSYI